MTASLPYDAAWRPMQQCRQERSDGRRGGGEGGAGRNGKRVPQGRGQPGGDDPITACGPPIGDEGEDPGDQPAPGAGAHLPGGTPCIAPRSVPPRLGAGGRPVPARAASESHGCGQARPSPSRSAAAPLSAEIVKLDRDLALLVSQATPALLALAGVGTDVAGALLVAAGDNPERLSSEA